VISRDVMLDLLTLIAATDNRNIDEPDIEVWRRILGNITADEAADAIMAHFRERPGVWLEPGHVVVRVKAARRDAYERSNPDYRDLDRAEAEADEAAPPPRDQWGHIDKAAPDPEEYPANWTPEQRLAATWATMQQHREQREYEQAIKHPSTLLSSPPATAAARAAAIQQFASGQLSLDEVDDAALPHVNPLLVPCPHCTAKAGARCTLPGMPGHGREPMESIAGHPSRIEAAARAAGHPEQTVQAIVTQAQRRQYKRQTSRWTDRDRAVPPVAQRAAEGAVTASPVEGLEQADG
jgi:hypothetical protein